MTMPTAGSRLLEFAQESGQYPMDAGDLVWIARAVAEEYGAPSSESAVRDANEAMRGIPRR